MTRTIQDKYYPLRVWASTILVAPIFQILFIILYLKQGGWDGFIGVMGALVFLGAFVSVPAFLLFYFLYLSLNSIIKNVWILKGLLFLFGIVLLIATLYSLVYFLGGGFIYLKSRFFILIYGIFILISIIFYGRPDINYSVKEDDIEIN